MSWFRLRGTGRRVRQSSRRRATIWDNAHFQPELTALRPRASGPAEANLSPFRRSSREAWVVSTTAAGEIDLLGCPPPASFPPAGERRRYWLARGVGLRIIDPPGRTEPIHLRHLAWHT